MLWRPVACRLTTTLKTVVATRTTVSRLKNLSPCSQTAMAIVAVPLPVVAMTHDVLTRVEQALRDRRRTQAEAARVDPIVDTVNEARAVAGQEKVRQAEVVERDRIVVRKGNRRLHSVDLNVAHRALDEIIAVRHLGGDVARWDRRRSHVLASRSVWAHRRLLGADSVHHSVVVVLRLLVRHHSHRGWQAVVPVRRRLLAPVALVRTAVRRGDARKLATVDGMVRRRSVVT